MFSAEEACEYSNIMHSPFSYFPDDVIHDIIDAIWWGDHYTEIEIPEGISKEEYDSVKEDLLFRGYKIEEDELEWIVSW